MWERIRNRSEPTCKFFRPSVDPFGDCFGLEEEIFYLAYGGLHWSANQIEDLARLERRWYVKRLQLQQEREQESMKRK